jgi:hypothetical protein
MPCSMRGTKGPNILANGVPESLFLSVIEFVDKFLDISEKGFN